VTAASQQAVSRKTSQLKPNDHVVVIGAGPAGLTAAYQLAKSGVRVTVLEADDMVGGISRTAQYKGYRFDIGGHRFFTKITPVEELWHEILGAEFIQVPRLSRIHYSGKYFDYPLKAGNALRGLGIWKAITMVISYLWSHIRPYPVEENLEQWVSNRFGKRLYRTFFKTYTEKVWGIPCTEIRAEWAAQRIQGLSLAKAILNAASLQKRSDSIKTLINEFQYPRLGPGQMWEMATDRIRALGGRVLMKHDVTKIETQQGVVTAVCAKTPNGEERFAAQHVISTMPIRHLVRALDPAVPEAIRTSGEGLNYRDFLTVALIIDQEKLFPDNWMYIHTPGVKVGRIQNFNNWSQAMVPEAGKTCLGLEYFCFEGDGMWTMADSGLVALATKELGELGLADPTKVVDGTVVRMPKAYPVYDAVYREHLNVVRSHIDHIPNLHTVGRNGMHKYNNQDHSMLTAMMTVANMRGASHDVWSVNTDYEYHEEQRIEAPSDSSNESSNGDSNKGGSGGSAGGLGSGGPVARRAAAPGMRASVGA
jgi:protoporphyrinogen oxidase